MVSTIDNQHFERVKILTWTKRGTTVCMWSPLWFWQKFKNFGFKLKKCFFSWKEIVSIRIGWFRPSTTNILMSENFDMDQRGHHSMHVVPPLVLTKIQKLVFKLKKCLISRKEIVSIRFGWFQQSTTNILVSENFDMDKRWHHSMHVVPPLVLTKIQKFKNLFLSWKNACFHERK